MTYGIHGSPRAWPKYDRFTPECFLCVVRSKSVRFAMPSELAPLRPGELDRGHSVLEVHEDALRGLEPQVLQARVVLHGGHHR
jgi:hypothetical protein